MIEIKPINDDLKRRILNNNSKESLNPLDDGIEFNPPNTIKPGIRDTDFLKEGLKSDIKTEDLAKSISDLVDTLKPKESSLKNPMGFSELSEEEISEAMVTYFSEDDI